MRVKQIQLYSNDCGIKAVENLLDLYGIKKKVKLDYSKDGTTMYEMTNYLKKYFYNVDAVSFDIDEIKKVKNFNPFIALIKKGDISHYVVIHKKNKYFLYIIDSLFKRTYMVAYKEFKKVDSKCYIVPSTIKKIETGLSNNRYLLAIPFLSIVESIFSLSTTIMLQQIIDNGINDAILYIIVQLSILFITLVKIKMFLRLFKTMDEKLVISTLKGVFNLSESHLEKHNKKELYYRVFDAYSYKNQMLSLVFDMFGDGVLLLLSIALMCIYSFKLTIMILILCSVVVLASIIYFKLIRKTVEEKRVNEYEFIDSFKQNFNEKNIGDYKEVEAKLLTYQKSDYQNVKLNFANNYVLLSFQSLVTCILIMLYVSGVATKISTGSLIAIINLSYLIISPLLSLCNQVLNLSNMKLLYKRLKNIEENIM